jgi:hypothetical protein
MFYVVTTDEGTRVTRKLNPMEEAKYAYMVMNSKVHWMVYDGELVDDDFIVPKVISPLLGTKRSKRKSP